jgi:lipopolysaccharide exporter
VTDVRTNAELTEATAKGLRWITVARVGTELLLLGSMVLLARLIPPSAFGMYALAVLVQELATSVPSEGVGSALVQRRSVDREHLQGGLALTLAIGAGLAALTLVLSQVLVQPVFGDATAGLVAMSTPWFLIGAVLALPMAMLRRELDFRRLSVLELMQSAIRSSASIFLAATFGMDASALVLGGLIGAFAMLALALVYAPMPLPRWRGRAVRDILPYGGPAALATVAWTGFRNGDYAVVGARLGSAQAGYYWRGFQLAVEYQRKLTSVMSQMGFPVLARTASVEDLFLLRRRMVQLLCVLLFPVMACLSILAPVVIPWLFGPEWEPAVLPTQILTGAGAATVIIDQVGAVLMARGRSRALLGYGVAHFVVYIGAVVVASRWGLGGVAIAAVVVHGIFLVIAYQVMLHDRPEPVLSVIWGDVSAATTSCAVLALAAVPTDLLLDGVGAPALVQIVAVSAVAAVAYLGTLRIGFDDAWSDLAALLRRVLPARRVRAIVAAEPVAAGRAS